jgi:6-phosphogluconolactonase
MAETQQIIVEKSPLNAAARAAEVFKSIVSEAVSQRGVCYLALSGGTTPRATYSSLAEIAICDEAPWSQVEVFFGDEHDVPQDDVDSNYAMVQRTLLDHAPIDWQRVYPMRADAKDIAAASAEYENIIRRTLPDSPTGIPQFDLVMLGMGGDGHTASLFPNSAALEEAHKLVVACHVSVLGRNRMTMTYPLINAARNILFLVTGDDKANVVKRVFREEDQSLPAARVSATHGMVHVVLDTAAARLMKG